MSLLRKHASPNASHDHRSNYGRGLIVVSDYVSLIGSAVADPTAAGTIDVLVKDDGVNPKYWQDSVSALISRTVAKALGKPTRIIFNPLGPHDGHFVPAFDLVLRPSTGEYKLQKSVSGQPNVGPFDVEHHHDSIMVAFPVHPDVSRQIGIRGGVQPSEHHITLGYLGKLSNIDPSRHADLNHAVKDFASTMPPMSGVIGGVARFNSEEEDGREPLVATVDVPHLHRFVTRLHDHLLSKGFAVDHTHGHTGHITTAFLPKGQGIQNMDPFPNAPGVQQPAVAKAIDRYTRNDMVGGIVTTTADPPPGNEFAGMDNSTMPVGNYPKIPLQLDSINLHLGDTVTNHRLTGQWNDAVQDAGSPNGPGASPGINLANPLETAPAASNFGEPVTTAVATEGEPMEFDALMLKNAPEKRYTFSVVYKASTPEAVHFDAHNEFTTQDELQAAQWDYVRRGDRSVYLQHGLTQLSFRKAGEWVDIANLPFAVEAPMYDAERGTMRKVKIPAGSTYMGTIWEPWAWALIKAGRIRGYSFGGSAARVNLPV